MPEAMLDDGSYDAFVVDAEAVDDDAHAPSGASRVALDMTITAGEHKGEHVRTIATRDALRLGSRDTIELFGWPCTLHVENGVPRIEL
jgi:hypothetical protein